MDPEEPAWLQAETYKRQGRQRDAELMWQIARQPRFRWFGRWTRPNMQLKVRKYLERVRCTQPGAVPLMVVLRHQGKSCSRTYIAGGDAEDALTRRWYEDFADAVGDARVVIAFEPDSLGTVDCLAPSRRKARLDTLRYGVDVLSRLPNATIYLEAGASDWEPAKRTARQLRYIGIHKVRGFMLNVTHYDWTGNNIGHGLDISRRVGGKPVIISTSFNGRGPVHFRRWLNRRKNIWRTINVWCHPLKRGLGTPPNTDTSHPKVDAYMWIGRPGFSGGKCNGGPMPIGSWWPERALMFATYATTWERPRRGTRNGHFRRYNLAQLGGHRAGTAGDDPGPVPGGPKLPPGVTDDGRRALGAERSAPSDRGRAVPERLLGEAQSARPLSPGELATGGYIGRGFAAAREDVKLVQRLLSESGFRTTVDGDFGPHTEARLRAFQRSHRLRVDGIVGRQTMMALEEYRGAD